MEVGNGTKWNSKPGKFLTYNYLTWRTVQVRNSPLLDRLLLKSGEKGIWHTVEGSPGTAVKVNRMVMFSSSDYSIISFPAPYSLFFLPLTPFSLGNQCETHAYEYAWPSITFSEKWVISCYVKFTSLHFPICFCWLSVDAADSCWVQRRQCVVLLLA